MPNKFEDIGFSDFRIMANDASLSPNEKIGFPDYYRKGFEEEIYHDIRSKLSNLDRKRINILDIGPGCSGLPNMLISDCKSRQQNIILIDSAEMLSHLPDSEGITKLDGFYPDCAFHKEEWFGRIDVIICYSVFHYIFVEASFWRFIDYSLKFLAPGGQMLIGDIPNVSKRKRFFSSENGKAFHKAFMKTNEDPVVEFLTIENDKIDDAVIMGVVMRARAEGCDAYLMPQPASLPMANRREDIVIYKP